MTNSIKPNQGLPPRPQGLDTKNTSGDSIKESGKPGVSKSGISSGAGSSFDAKVGKAGVSETASGQATAGQLGSSQVHGSQKSTMVQQLTAQLKSGEITPQQMMDSLVDQTLEKDFGRLLNEGQKKELRSTIESVLKNDPTIAALLGSIETPS